VKLVGRRIYYGSNSNNETEEWFLAKISHTRHPLATTETSFKKRESPATKELNICHLIVLHFPKEKRVTHPTIN
jgi:hypothetical protein